MNEAERTSQPGCPIFVEANILDRIQNGRLRTIIAWNIGFAVEAGQQYVIACRDTTDHVRAKITSVKAEPGFNPERLTLDFEVE